VTRPSSGTGSDGLAGRSGDAPNLATTSPLAALLTAAGAGGSQPLAELGFHQGTVVEWDPLTGTNVIEVLGAPIEDVPVLTTGDNVLLTVGNQVAVLRYRSKYFVLGRITAPGGGNAFAWQYGERITTGDVTTVFPTFGDPTFAAPVVDFEVGTSRRALMFYSVQLDMDPLTAVWVKILTGGSSTVEFVDLVQINNSTDTDLNTVVTAFFTLADGYNGTMLPGPATVTLKYALGSVGDVVETTSQRILIVPF
jgi:hypothetical protein